MSNRPEMQTRRIVFRVKGMDCAEETSALQAELSKLGGVVGVACDILARKLTVEIDERTVSTDDIQQVAAKIGLAAEPWSEPAQEDATDEARARRVREVVTIASGLLIVAGLVMHASSAGWKAAFRADGASELPLGVRLAYLIAAVAGAWFVFPKAGLAMRRMRPDMNLLMCVAILGAILIGEWLEGATVAFLFGLSLTLEAWSIGRARRAISALMALAPTTARLSGGSGSGQTVAASSVEVGRVVLVLPGEKFPLDGRISAGASTVDQSPITGESVPVLKEVGNEVFAGTINQESAVEVITTKPFADSTLSRIANMVGEAQARRSPSEQWVERFARIYTPLVMIGALLIALVPPLLGAAWSTWIYEALVLLVIACPCALVISTPVSIVAALAASARHGILVKGGRYMEVPARVAVVAIDKTGTLTEGRPRVQAIVAGARHAEAEVLSAAAAIESRSTHPLGLAITAHATALGITPGVVTSASMIAGKGAHARVDGIDYWLGSHRYLEERGQEEPEVHEQLESLSASGSSVVVVGREDHVCGFISLADNLRGNARDVVRALKAAGVSRVVMLTGDNRGTAEAIGREAGVDEVLAELLPEDKVRAIEDLVAKHGIVAMVGDGVNDAPALARSSLGIAMGVAGTDAALETADVVLMGDDLSKLPWLIHHSRRTMRIIRQNIGVSLAVKALFVGLSISGHASLWAAIASDMGVSLLVVVNALRLLRN